MILILIIKLKTTPKKNKDIPKLALNYEKVGLEQHVPQTTAFESLSAGKIESMHRTKLTVLF